MGEQTTISWTDHTFNPWEGCTKISPGCANCYAEARNYRFKGDNWGQGKPRRRTEKANWRQPLKWNQTPLICQNGKTPIKGAPGGHGPYVYFESENYKCFECSGNLHRARVFCASLADWLDDEVPIEWLADLLKLIHDTPNLDWLLLTKRPENFMQRMIQASLHLCGYRDGQIFDIPIARTDDAALDFAMEWSKDGKAPHNVWIGVSVEDQQRANERIPELLKIPAKVRFLSVEPMLGPIDFACAGNQVDHPYSLRGNLWELACENHCSWAGFESDLIADPTQSDKDVESNGTRFVCPKCHSDSGLVERPDGAPNIDWAIFGGESGKGARPCDVDWIRDGVKQCQAAGVPVFVKQLGAKIVRTGFCRDCADEDGICPRDGLPCAGLRDKKGADPSEWPEDLRIQQWPEQRK